MTPAIKAARVVVPARDEEDLLPACLEALAVAADRVRVPVRVVVALDSCTDGTSEVCDRYGVETVHLTETNVGRARAEGALLALAGEDELDRVWLASTDADTRVPPGWFRDYIALADDGADAVIGVVKLDDQGAAIVGEHHDARYTRSVRPDGTHWHVHGANLGVRASAYLRAGGFPPIALHEDRALVCRLQSLSDVTVVRSHHISVTTSARIHGRCQSGFAADLAKLASELVLDV